MSRTTHNDTFGRIVAICIEHGGKWWSPIDIHDMAVALSIACKSSHLALKYYCTSLHATGARDAWRSPSYAVSIASYHSLKTLMVSSLTPGITHLLAMHVDRGFDGALPNLHDFVSCDATPFAYSTVSSIVDALGNRPKIRSLAVAFYDDDGGYIARDTTTWRNGAPVILSHEYLERLELAYVVPDDACTDVPRPAPLSLGALPRLEAVNMSGWDGGVRLGYGAPRLSRCACSPVDVVSPKLVSDVATHATTSTGRRVHICAILDAPFSSSKRGDVATTATTVTIGEGVFHIAHPRTRTYRDVARRTSSLVVTYNRGGNIRRIASIADATPEIPTFVGMCKTSLVDLEAIDLVPPDTCIFDIDGVVAGGYMSMLSIPSAPLLTHLHTSIRRNFYSHTYLIPRAFHALRYIDLHQDSADVNPIVLHISGLSNARCLEVLRLRSAVLLTIDDFDDVAAGLHELDINAPLAKVPSVGVLPAPNLRSVIITARSIDRSVWQWAAMPRLRRLHISGGAAS